jgi:OCT family organic cation transporter-like MFS transporter 4/5
MVFVVCIMFMSLTGVAQAVAPNYVTFQVFVFMNALGTAGVYPLAFIIGKFLVYSSMKD